MGHELRAAISSIGMEAQLARVARPSDLIQVDRMAGAVKNSHSRAYLQHLFSFRGSAFKQRGCEIPEVEWRGITLCQLSSTARFIQLVLNTCTLIDDNDSSPTLGEWINWELINMYHISEHFVRPLTAPFQCS